MADVEGKNACRITGVNILVRPNNYQNYSMEDYVKEERKRSFKQGMIKS